ncbi:MAG: CotH kinase family protein, partial [bacterium]
MFGKKVFKLSTLAIFMFLGIVISLNACYADGLVINEIVAMDAYGGTDWIEFYVVGSSSVYLGDYSVVDDSAAHTPAPLPAITLGSGEFLVIQASAEDPGEGFYYVPFGLGADDSLTLYQGSTVVDMLDWEDGDAPSVYSFGRFPNGTGSAQTLTPTPNATNETPFSIDLLINEVLVNDSGGGPDWIELYVVGDSPVYLGDYSVVDDNPAHTPEPLPGITLGPGEFCLIKATTVDPGDGSFYVPFGLGAGDSVTLYRESYVVDVLAWSAGQAPTDISFGRLPDGTGEAQPLTPTPGASNEIFEVFPSDRVIDVRIEMYDAQWEDILENPMAEQYQVANIVYDGIRINDVAVRTKGQSSLMTVAGDPNGIRFGLKVDFNRYITGQDLSGIQKLNFNNGFTDPTFMRDFLSYYLMRSMGVPTPRCAFVNLYVNNVRLGLYAVVEQIDDEFVEARFPKGDGDLYKAEMGTSLLQDPNDNYPSLELKTNEDTTDHSALVTMVDVLNNYGDYESVIDVDEVLRYFAVNTVLVSLDSYQGDFGHNFYLYEEDGVFRILPWDYNMSFGTFNMGCDRENIMAFMIDEPTISKFENRPLIAKLLEDPEYLAIYHGYLNQIISGPFSPSTMNQLIDDTADLIREHVYADNQKFYTDEEFEQTLTDDLETDPNKVTIQGFNRGFGMVLGLKTFVSERVASVRDQL